MHNYTILMLFYLLVEDVVGSSVMYSDKHKLFFLYLLFLLLFPIVVGLVCEEVLSDGGEGLVRVGVEIFL